MSDGTIIKRGQAYTVTTDDPNGLLGIKSAEMVMTEGNAAVLHQFEKQAQATARELKSIAPKAKDFLYFTAVMMHAAEAALIDDNGNIKTASDGNPHKAEWVQDGESWKWSCSDPSIMPYKNSNNDIFPESELKKAYKKWIGCPLCLDHKSSSVDAIRGVVVDTYYDDKFKRIIALCALDKKNYPDLARKVSTGYATSVSMGTAVGRAICTDCGAVAKVESDFCDHMRSKSCYGEINVELKPIELSIVVNGADQKAKIRQIVASANSIASYVEMKEKDLSTKEALSSEEIHQLKADVEKLQQEMKKLDVAVKEADSNNADPAYGQPGQGSVSMESAEGPYPDSKKDLSTPPPRYASERSEMVGKVLDLHEKLDNFINKLAFKLTDKDLPMADKKAYFQGGGGVNEPAPKQVKYEKEDYETIRDNIDKQMVGQNPFPDTGPVDGMHPGYDSYGETEEARKRRLQRLAAETEKRQLRRQAAIDKAKETLKKRKEAYHQGGGDVNEPTPGKPKYEKEDYKQNRDKNDKQMAGKAPFPGVGSVDGLYSDDLKKKEILQRAHIKARFIKAANPDSSDNKANSYWQVLANDKEIMKLTVSEISGGRAEALFDEIATKNFGRKIISTIKSEGYDKAVKLFKSAQPVPAEAGPAAAPAAPPDAAGAMGAGMPGGDMPGDAGEGVGSEGDPKDMVGEKIRELDNLVQELSEAFEALRDQEMPEEAPMAASASAGVSPYSMCKTLNGALRKGIKQAVAEVKDHIEELKLVSYVYDTDGAVTSGNTSLVSGVTKDAIDDANKTIANTYKLMSAFVKYARGAEALVKRAEANKMVKKKANDSEEATSFEPDALAADDNEVDINSVEELDALLADDGDENDDRVNLGLMDPDARAQALAPRKVPSHRGPMLDRPHSGVREFTPGGADDPSAHVRMAPPSGAAKPSKPMAPKPTYEQTGDPFAEGGILDVGNATAMYDENKGAWVIEDVNGPDSGAADDLSVDERELGAAASANLNTKEGRAAMRMKIAQKGVTFSDMLQKAHPGGGADTKLDNKPGLKDGEHVEDLEETHDAVMDVATAPPRVRKQAEEIQRLVTAGAIDPSNDFPALVAKGLDPAAVKYWKAMWGEAKDPKSSQFASELVKEHQSKKAAEEMKAYKIKLARSYELAHQMADVGLIGSSRESIAEQVEGLMEFGEKEFTSMQRMANRHASLKKAASLPEALIEASTSVSTDIVLPAPDSEPSDLRSQLDMAFNAPGKKY